jgi:hypothetical protein
MLQAYLEGNSMDFVGYMYAGKFEKIDAINILTYSLQHER